MRWYVDISLIGSTAPLSRFCVEAAQWQQALQSVRTVRGDLAPFGNFSIELRDDGYRAIDPVSRTRYEVQRAPDDAPLVMSDAAIVEDPAEVTPAIVNVRVSEPPPVERAARPRPSSRAARARSKAPAIPDDPVPRTAGSDPPKANGSVAQGPPLTKIPSAPPPPRPSAPPAGLASGLPFKVLSSRKEEPTPASPLTYRELALAVATGTSVADAESVARAQYEALRSSIHSAPKGKFIQLAVFDHEFTTKPRSPPLVVLTFKDWRGPEPDVRRSPGPAMSPNAAPPAPITDRDAATPSRAPTRLEPVVVPQEARPSRPTTPGPAAAPASAPPPAPAPASSRPPPPAPASSRPPPPAPASARPPAPASSRPPPPASSRPPAPAPAPAPAPHPTPSALQRAAKDMVSEDEHTLVDVKAPASAPPAALTPSSPAPAAGPSEPPPAVREAKTVRMPSVPSPPPAESNRPPPSSGPVISVTMAPISAPISVPSSSPIPTPPVSAPSTLVVRQARGPRRRGDDLISDLFEACCDLGFLGDPLEGAEFVLSLVLDTLHCRFALVSFYDINAREFVVVRQGLAQGSQPVPMVALTRASEKTSLIAKAMASHRALVLDGSGVELLADDPRWRALGLSPKAVLCAPVESGGRYLGLLEIAEPLDGAEFSESDGHALTYVGNQLAEFLSQRELVIDPERVMRPKLSQVQRRPSA